MNSTFLTTDPGSRARLGRIETTHVTFDTPRFMPVGTQATVKGLLPRDLWDHDVRILLGNTYHLSLRPGAEIIREMGGLHRFMGWQGAILTDSGGFQIYSLARIRKIDDDGVTFQSHLDGSPQHFDPERVIALQEAYGSDIMMALDECPPSTAERETIRTAMGRTTRWLDRCLAARTRHDDCALFGIVQGGIHEDLRAEHVAEICAREACEGFAIGGLSVGEPPEEMWRVASHTAPLMPTEKPRYLMGVGTPKDLLTCIGAGVDLFDCVMPTRNGRNGQAFTSTGQRNLKNRRYLTDAEPLDAACRCYVCRTFSRAYVRHLVVAKEMLAAELLSLHNVAFYLDLMRQAREAIAAGRYADFARDAISRLESGDAGEASDIADA